MLEWLLTMIGFFLFIYWIIISIKRDRKSKNTVEDIIIVFKNKEKAPNIVRNEIFTAIANWKRYGDRTFRGFSTLNKEKLILLINEEYGISQSNYEIFSPSDWYFASVAARL